MAEKDGSRPVFTVKGSAPAAPAIQLVAVGKPPVLIRLYCPSTRQSGGWSGGRRRCFSATEMLDSLKRYNPHGSYTSTFFSGFCQTPVWSGGHNIYFLYPASGK